MNIPQIQIEITRGRIGLRIDKPVQTIEQPRAIIHQEQLAAVLEMSSTPAKLSIDTTEARADLDLKSVFKRIEEYAQLGKQGVMEGIARRAEEGQQLLRIENGGNMIKELAIKNSTPSPNPIGIRFVGNRSKVNMSFQPGILSIEATPQKPRFDVTVQAPVHHYEPGKVTGFIEEWPSIQIDVKG